MVRQERNREKAEKRKARKAERLEGPAAIEGDPTAVVSDGSEAGPGPAVAPEVGARPAPLREAVAKDAEVRS